MIFLNFMVTPCQELLKILELFAQVKKEKTNKARISLLRGLNSIKLLKDSWHKVEILPFYQWKRNNGESIYGYKFLDENLTLK